MRGTLHPGLRGQCSYSPNRKLLQNGPQFGICDDFGHVLARALSFRDQLTTIQEKASESCNGFKVSLAFTYSHRAYSGL